MVEKSVSALRAARMRRGVTIRELRKRTGIATGRLSMMERGMAKPSPEERVRLAVALDTPEEELFRMH